MKHTHTHSQSFSSSKVKWSVYLSKWSHLLSSQCLCLSVCVPAVYCLCLCHHWRFHLTFKSIFSGATNQVFTGAQHKTTAVKEPCQRRGAGCWLCYSHSAQRLKLTGHRLRSNLYSIFIPTFIKANVTPPLSSPVVFMNRAESCYSSEMLFPFIISNHFYFIVFPPLP